MFSVGFNTWLAHKQPAVAPFDPVSTGVTQETIGFLIKYGFQANQTWAATTLAAARQQLDTAAAINQTVYALMGLSMPAWAEAEYSGLTTGNFTSHGVAFDIDNPGAAAVSTAGIHAWLDEVGCHPAFGGWILANEPDFRVSQTPHTMGKYRGWLEQRHGTVAALNKAWGTGYGSFADIASQPANPGDDPSDPLLLGGPVRWNSAPPPRGRPPLPGLCLPPHMRAPVCVGVWLCGCIDMSCCRCSSTTFAFACVYVCVYVCACVYICVCISSLFHHPISNPQTRPPCRRCPPSVSPWWCTQAAEWWDWNNFNNARVTEFFAMLRDAIHSWDAKGRPVTARCMSTTIKLQDGNEFKVHTAAAFIPPRSPHRAHPIALVEGPAHDHPPFCCRH